MGLQFDQCPSFVPMMIKILLKPEKKRKEKNQLSYIDDMGHQLTYDLLTLGLVVSQLFLFLFFLHSLLLLLCLSIIYIRGIFFWIKMGHYNPNGKLIGHINQIEILGRALQIV